MMAEGYALTEDYQQAVAYYCATSPSFFGRIGHAIDPSKIGHASSKLTIEASRAIYLERGRGPDSCRSVVQRIRRWVEDGRVRFDDLLLVNDLFDALEEDGKRPDEDAVLAEIVPVLRRVMQQEAAISATEDYAKGSDFTRTISIVEKAKRLGEVDESIGIRLGAGSAEEIATIRKLEKLPLGVPELDLRLRGGLRRGCFGLLLGGTGDGKCHAAGQGILMHDGSIRRVEDVRVGDCLMGPDGKPRRVIELHNGVGELFEVRPMRGASWRVNANHVLSLVHTMTRQIMNVSVREWLAWPKKRKHVFKLYRSGAVDFGGADAGLPIDPYLLGLLLGDRSFKYEDVRITSADREIVVEVERLASDLGLRVSVHGKDRTAPGYGLAGTMGKKNPVTQALARLGLRGLGSGEKFVPHVFKVASRSARLELLAGLIDTDGSKNKTAYDLVSKSPRLAADVAFLARSLGFAALVTPCRKRCQTGAEGDYYRVSIVGRGLRSVPCRVARKCLSVRLQKKDPLRCGFSVVSTGEIAPFFGFSLDGDARYLLDDFTVTHNSMGLGHIAATGLRRGLFVAYATLEVIPADVFARIEANLTGIPIDVILEDPTEAERRCAAMTGGGILCVHEFTPLATTFPDIAAWVEEIERVHGRDVDLLCTDYGDKIGAPKAKGKTEDGGYRTGLVVFEGMRNWANQKRRWHWSASQATRRKDRKKLLEVDDTADSMHKVRVADLVVTLNLDGDGQMTFRSAKARHGGAGANVGPMPTDFELGRICPIVEADPSTFGAQVLQADDAAARLDKGAA